MSLPITPATASYPRCPHSDSGSTRGGPRGAVVTWKGLKGHNVGGARAQGSGSPGPGMVQPTNPMGRRVHFSPGPGYPQGHEEPSIHRHRTSSERKLAGGGVLGSLRQGGVRELAWRVGAVVAPGGCGYNERRRAHAIGMNDPAIQNQRQASAPLDRGAREVQLMRLDVGEVFSSRPVQARVSPLPALRFRGPGAWRRPGASPATPSGHPRSQPRRP